MSRTLSLHWAWLGLVALTLVGALAGEGAAQGWALKIIVTATILVKGWLVARHFLEVHQAHPLIRRLILGYIATMAGMVLVVGAFGPAIARWTALS